MALSQRLLQQQKQQMTMAPQMRQSLEMLQLPAMELRAAIRQELEQNPAIEDVEDPKELSLDATLESPQEPITDRKEDNDGALDFSVDSLMEMDEETRDYLFENQESFQKAEDDEARREYMFNSLRQPETLRDHLLLQLRLHSEYDPLVAGRIELLIGSLGDDGYLRSPLADLTRVAQCSAQVLEEALFELQKFDPLGVGARDLAECLLLQVRNNEKSAAKLAGKIIELGLDFVAQRRFGAIASALGCSTDEVRAAVDLIKTLNPRPGAAFSAPPPEYVRPEIVAVKGDDGEWRVEMDTGQLPHIRISNHYRQLLHNENVNDEAKSYIRERIRSGIFIIRSLDQRLQTISKIATEIVRAQQDFLEKGIMFLKPLTMWEIASRSGFHETTVSRTVANKYIRTPAGTFELRFFFSAALRTDRGKAFEMVGGDVSNKAVRTLIKGLIDSENPRKPLSDKAIMDSFAKSGISIARRTIAKYREQMHIPPSAQRRQG